MILRFLPQLSMDMLIQSLQSLYSFKTSFLFSSSLQSWLMHTRPFHNEQFFRAPQLAAQYTSHLKFCPYIRREKACLRCYPSFASSCRPLLIPCIGERDSLVQYAEGQALLLQPLITTFPSNLLHPKILSTQPERLTWNRPEGAGPGAVPP